MNRQLSDTQEDYLETIIGLIAKKGAARVRDIAESLNVHKSTVTAALKSLSEHGYVNYSPYELTTLTEPGQAIAEKVQHKHTVIRRFLTEILQIEPEQAERNACRMEHGMDSDVLDRLVALEVFLRHQDAHALGWAAALTRAIAAPSDT